MITGRQKDINTGYQEKNRITGKQKDWNTLMTGRQKYRIPKKQNHKNTGGQEDRKTGILDDRKIETHKYMITEK